MNKIEILIVQQCVKQGAVYSVVENCDEHANDSSIEYFESVSGV